MRDERRVAALTPLYFEAGAALADCQTMEYGVALLLHHFSRMGTRGLDPSMTTAIMEGSAKRTAGQLIAMLRAHLEVSAGIEDALAEGLKCRNLLIHRFLVDNAERIADATQRAEVVKELRRLRSKVQRADRVLRPFVEGLSHALDGLDPVAFRQEALSRFYGDQE